MGFNRLFKEIFFKAGNGPYGQRIIIVYCSIDIKMNHALHDIVLLHHAETLIL